MILLASNSIDSIVQLITVLLIFVFVLAITLLVTKWMANFQKQQTQCKNIQIIETTKISPNQYAQIIKIADKYVAVAISKDNVTLLSSIDEDKLILDADKQTAKMEFASIFKALKKNPDTYTKRQDIDEKDNIDQ